MLLLRTPPPPHLPPVFPAPSASSTHYSINSSLHQPHQHHQIPAAATVFITVHLALKLGLFKSITESRKSKSMQHCWSFWANSSCCSVEGASGNTQNTLNTRVTAHTHKKASCRDPCKRVIDATGGVSGCNPPPRWWDLLVQNYRKCKLGLKPFLVRSLEEQLDVVDIIVVFTCRRIQNYDTGEEMARVVGRVEFSNTVALFGPSAACRCTGTGLQPAFGPSFCGRGAARRALGTWTQHPAGQRADLTERSTARG
ncbi:hypothetical protein EYF80_013673 [Liparis tanakae]|uniref:Uncharacterized protein n=1 Tax=Liparis tanakae TaxID=230148 RepID=A0A4Z2IFS5_9TELE|nr:hypothetical protein EYF80_013673 [Liparis tanakae]